MAVKADIVDFLASEKELVSAAFDLAVAVKAGRLTTGYVTKELKDTFG